MTGPRPVLRFGNSCLRQICEPAEPGSEATAAILDALWSALENGDGVGLAAPQIGILRRILVVRKPSAGSGEHRLEMVNPTITETVGPRVPFEEGCLSFPGLYLTVWRQAGIKVRYFDRRGRQQTLRDRELVARIVQHEVDHLDGRLFIDHLSVGRRILAAPRLGFIRLVGLLRREVGW